MSLFQVSSIMRTFRHDPSRLYILFSMALRKRKSDSLQLKQRESADEDGELCSKCRKIDLETAFGEYARTLEGVYVGDIGEIGPRTRDSSCILCSLVAEILFSKPRQNVPSPNTQVYLQAVSAARSVSGFDENPRQSKFQQLRRNSVLQICWREKGVPLDSREWKDTGENSKAIYGEYLAPSEPYVGQGKPSIVCRRLDPYNIDFSILRRWLSCCSSSHRTWCKTRNRRPFSTFRVIDCSSRRIVQAPEDCSYCALSYVWGAAEREEESEPPKPGDLPKTLPRVIRDALVVTEKLNYQYLWVDKYCINQEDLEDKIFQISNMDLVYNNAQVTIIASAGEDSNYGLPGVGDRPRNRQPAAPINGNWIVSSLPEPQTQIRKARWSTRGWTYQEAALSPRRLFFTEQQVYFECDSMYCMEAIDLPLGSYHTKDGDYFRTEANWGDISMFNLRYSQFIDRNIIEYSSRSLSYQSDALNGILGTLKFHERQRKTKAPSHLWGVPLQVHWPAGASFEHPKFQVDAFIPGDNSRTASMDFMRGLCWYMEQPGTRRTEFPSWSWTGWEGKLSNESWTRTRSHWVDDDLRVRASIEIALSEKVRKQGSVGVVVDNDQSLPSDVVGVDQLRRESVAQTSTRVEVSPFLRVTAGFVRLQIIHANYPGAFRGRYQSPREQKAKYFAVLNAPNGMSYYSPFFLCGRQTSEEERDFDRRVSTQSSWRGMIAAYTSHVNLRPLPVPDSSSRVVSNIPAAFVIVLDERDGLSQRIGDVDLCWLYTPGPLSSEPAEDVERAVSGLAKTFESIRIG